MVLLDKLTKDGSTLSFYDGQNPTKYQGQSTYKEDLSKSQLDLDGKEPLKYDAIVTGVPVKGFFI